LLGRSQQIDIFLQAILQGICQACCLAAQDFDFVGEAGAAADYLVCERFVWAFSWESRDWVWIESSGRATALLLLLLLLLVVERVLERESEGRVVLR
jgi:hypothetical protein